MSDTKRYAPWPEVQQRYGGWSRVTCWRYMARDAFPRPITVGGRNLWDVDELNAYDAERKRHRPQYKRA